MTSVIPPMPDLEFKDLLKNLRNCSLCAHRMRHEPRPVIHGLPTATLLIIGQAPGLKVYNTGMSFNDPSGDRLRSWLKIERNQFYDEQKIALMPMGLCFPGRDEKGGDLPPFKECAPLWHDQFLSLFENIRLTLLVGHYAQKYYLKKRCQPTLTQTVQAFQSYLPEFFPLPHPSWRNTGWIKKNPWFEAYLLPQLRERVHHNLSGYSQF